MVSAVLAGDHGVISEDVLVHRGNQLLRLEQAFLECSVDSLNLINTLAPPGPIVAVFLSDILRAIL